jgi:hypothetical protein
MPTLLIIYMLLLSRSPRFRVQMGSGDLLQDGGTMTCQRCSPTLQPGTRLDGIRLSVANA